MSRTERSSTLTTRERQLKATAVADYQAEQEQKAEDLRASEVTDVVADVIKDMSLYKEFKEIPILDSTFVELDVHIVGGNQVHENKYEFDDVAELADLQERGQSALNVSIGTPSEPLARAALAEINAKSHDILATFAGEDNAENTRF